MIPRHGTPHDIIINGWTIREAALPGDDQVEIDVLRKHVTIDHPDREWVIHWLKAYIDLGHHYDGEVCITDEHRDRATALAGFRLDLAQHDEWIPPVDDESPVDWLLEG